MTARGHRGPHHICPSLLGHNLEEDAERASEVVETVVWVGTLSRSQHIPIERCAIIFADAIIKVINGGIVTRSHPPVEEVQAIDSEGEKQA